MFKYLTFFRRRNKKALKLTSVRCPRQPSEPPRVSEPQESTNSLPNSEVIVTFQKLNVLTMKKQGIHSGSTETESDATIPKLLFPIVVVLGGSEC